MAVSKEKNIKNLNYANTIRELRSNARRNADIRAISDRMPYDLPDHRYEQEENEVTNGVE